MTIDKSGSKLSALHAVNAERGTPIKIRQAKFLNNVVEQDHRAIKRIACPMQGFTDFDCARVILSGIETMHMVKKGQMKRLDKKSRCPLPSSSARSFHKVFLRYQIYSSLPSYCDTTAALGPYHGTHGTVAVVLCTADTTEPNFNGQDIEGAGPLCYRKPT
ncbi:hypothetical protein AX768_30075 (plasmid) [Burkholderia sp. PAMC 28687]|nr:hypothetical protein AX768_30075 [Burkholderia sp. PAMC 28687]